MFDLIEKYCRLGWKVFPCKLYVGKDGKVVKAPCMEGWQALATSDLIEARQLFMSTGAKAVGILTGRASGITVLDIDVKAGENGFTELENRGIEIPIGPVSQTPSGGRHYPFKYTPQITNSAKRIPGVDTRNDGGFIVVAPATYPDGKPYEWVIDQEPWSLPLVEFPQGLLDILNEGKKKEDAGPLKVPEKIKEGGRNDILFKEACSLREKAYDAHEILGALKILNTTRCHPPLPEDELMLIAKQAGKYSPGEVDPATGAKKKKNQLDMLVKIMQKDGALWGLFGFNEFSYDIEFMKAPPWNPLLKVGKIITDTDVVMLKIYLSQIRKFEPSVSLLQEAIIIQSQNNMFHPVRSFLRSLAWDGQERLDTWLNMAVGCSDDAYTRAVSRKILAAAVSRVFNPGVKFDHMVVLEGAQGIGKSVLCRTLGGDWSAEINITENDKDVVDAMRGRWILEVPEMVCARKTEVDHLKAFISKQFDRARLAYRRNTEDFPRQSIFIGTINPSGDNSYLRDDTGNRRFWPIQCTHINIKWMRENRDQLLAEAVVASKAGEPLYIDNQSILDMAKIEQENRQQDDPWTQFVVEFLQTATDGFTSADVASRALHLEKGRIDRSVQTRLGIILKKLGVDYKKCGKDNVRKYFPSGSKKAVLSEVSAPADWSD